MKSFGSIDFSSTEAVKLAVGEMLAGHARHPDVFTPDAQAEEFTALVNAAMEFAKKSAQSP